MNAQTVLSSISSDRALWLAQYHAEVRKRDELSNLEGAKEIARAEGINIGIDNLTNLLRMGISLEEALKKLGR